MVCNANNDNHQYNNEIFMENYNENDNDIIDDIENDENVDDDQLQIVNHKTYIGMPIYESLGILLGSRIMPSTYFKYENQHICEYLTEASCSENVSQRSYPDIMQLEIETITTASGLQCDIYKVIIKTHWLKIVQRRWKKVMEKRMMTIRGRGSHMNRRFMEITGTHLPALANLPGLRGCLNDL
jgi:hypothetical protein